MENNFNSIDIETFGSDPIKPYCFVVIYNKIKNVSYGLDCVEKALSWLFDTCPSGSTFFAHNLNFDGGLMLNFLPNDVDIREVGTLLKRGDIYSLCLVKKNKILFFKCSSKIFPLSLEEIGPLFNIPNKLFFDHNSVNELNIQDPVFKSNVIKYCVRDALIVTNFLTKIKFSVISYSNFNYVYSISGLALNIFKKNFNYFDIPIQLDEDVDNLIRPSYYGGRCEVFGNLKKTESCYHFDFSGMYTNRLKELYPLGDFKIIKKIDKIECNGFYYVKVRSNLKLPILPYRHPVSKKLLFPNGVFSGLYWCEELLLFIENGGDILEIFYCIKFEKFEYVFKSFGLECENKRQSTRYDKVLWKLIPNSFIGRLGIKYDNEETIIILDTDYDPRDYNVISDRKINNNWIVRVHNKLELRKKVNVGNVIYPSIITSKARILWWNPLKRLKVITVGYCIATLIQFSLLLTKKIMF